MSKFGYLELRFLLVVIISIIIIICDAKLNLFTQIIKYTSYSTDLLYFVYNKPCLMFDLVSKILKGYKTIILENHALQQELLLKKCELLLLEQYQQENCRLRELINSSLVDYTKRMIARVIFINTDLWSHHLIIDKGKNDDIYIGQPVITETGIVGQIISIGSCSSSVLLVYDIKHALSVQIKRNNCRMILFGRGYNIELYAECPTNLDINIGDILVTSGLDGLFPEGYPVAIVSNIAIHDTHDILMIQAHPTVNFQSVHNVLLIWK